MVVRIRDGRAWRIGTDALVAWIENGTSTGRTITAAIPPVFDAYATVVEPDSDDQWNKHDRAVVALLSQHSAGQAWWLGYLDTGADDIVFPDAPKVNLYYGWHYVLVEAGPRQAATWRKNDRGMHGVLPELIFPADRSWLFSTLWDDGWSCIGGAAGLIDGFLSHPDLEARPVKIGQDASPPGLTLDPPHQPRQWPKGLCPLIPKGSCPLIQGINRQSARPRHRSPVRTADATDSIYG